MKKVSYLVLSLGFFTLLVSKHGQAFYTQKQRQESAQCFLKAYPSFFKSLVGNNLVDHMGHLWKLGQGKETLDEKLKAPDLIDTFAFKYPKGSSIKWPLPLNFDPGRIRDLKLLKAIYGKTSHEVERNLISIKWLPKSTDKIFRVTQVGGVAEKLKRISAAIDNLPKSIKQNVYDIQGGYNWRIVKGTSRLSAHSFGIAVDIMPATAKSYWKFSHPDKNGIYRYKNNFPMAIVKIFEKYGFIWGGKWYHYDSLHFEYRPEFFCK